MNRVVKLGMLILSIRITSFAYVNEVLPITIVGVITIIVLTLDAVNEVLDKS